MAGLEPIALVQPKSRMTYKGFLLIWIGFHVSRRAIKQSFRACAIKLAGIILQSYSGKSSTAVMVEVKLWSLLPVVWCSAADRGLAVSTAESDVGVAQLNVVGSASEASLFFL